MASLEHLIRTGQFEDLAFGLSLEEVRERIGDPDDVSISSKPLIWKYGGVELAFFREKAAPSFALDSISIHLRKDGPAFIRTECFSGLAGMDEADFRRYLNGLAHVEKVISGDEYFARQLVLDTGVRAAFEDGRLVNLFADRHRTMRKQSPASVAVGGHDDRLPQG